MCPVTQPFNMDQIITEVRIEPDIFLEALHCWLDHAVFCTENTHLYCSYKDKEAKLWECVKLKCYLICLELRRGISAHIYFSPGSRSDNLTKNHFSICNKAVNFVLLLAEEGFILSHYYTVDWRTRNVALIGLGHQFQTLPF